MTEQEKAQILALENAFWLGTDIARYVGSDGELTVENVTSVLNSGLLGLADQPSTASASPWCRATAGST